MFVLHKLCADNVRMDEMLITKKRDCRPSLSMDPVINMNSLSRYERNKTHVFKQDFKDDSDGGHRISLGTEFQIEAKEAIENERSPCVALQCADLLRRSVVC